MVSPTARQSRELVRRAAELAARRGMNVKSGDQLSLEFQNGSRIVGMAGHETTVRGYSAVSLLVIDEAARVSDAVFKAMLPMLAVSGAELWLMSTPFGKRGFFYEAWAHGGADWRRVRVTANECPRIPRKFLAEERRILGERWFRQEYLCEFVNPVDGVFDPETVEGALRDELEPLLIP